MRNRKLSINRETIRVLSEPQLREAAGGAQPTTLCFVRSALNPLNPATCWGASCFATCANP